MQLTQNTQIQELVRSNPRLVAVGGGTKPALSAFADGATRVEVAGLTGLLEYQPDEFTFTARAGTRIIEIDQALAEHGQYLPFDPPFVDSGATLGGTVASGLNGSGRYRYGGIRDFLLGLQFIDGQGQLLHVGGKVVKNAAGFDLSKLMVGSLGCYGILVELTFKVFPSPSAYTSLKFNYPALEDALEALTALTLTPVEIFALDIVIENDRAVLQARLGGSAETFPARTRRIGDILQRSEDEVVEGKEDDALWHSAREFMWVPPDHALVKVPVTPKRVLGLDRELADHQALRRYSVGSNLAWIAWPDPVEALDRLLVREELSGLVISGANTNPRLGVRVGEAFARRVKQALDPTARWVEV